MIVKSNKNRSYINKKLRHNEYYNTQEIFDELYKESKEGKNFYDLMHIITSKENILLAYRNIKTNKGSKTPGVDKANILDLGNKNINKLIWDIQKSFENYKPKPVRRVEIPKDNGKTRPLGIPTMTDRIIQQCILQVLDPICEAKFHPHSYGFRPNRNAHHAIKRLDGLINNSGYHYAVDVDIKGFFDNVNHGKLLKQMWSLGIRDKNLLKVISKMLKAEIKGIGIPTKGTPQGGILSPLLANIVLNELDWWISNQWETNFEMRHKLTGERLTARSSRYQALQRTRLKGMFIVRYADDFKIMCKDAKTAQKVFVAVKNWLWERLDLEISPEKSKVTNLRKNYTEFLGFRFKVKLKRNKWQLTSRISKKADKNIRKRLKEKVNRMRKNPCTTEANKYNSTVLGIQNYYKIATQICVDFNDIAFDVNRYIKQRLKKYLKKKKKVRKSNTYLMYYGEYNFKERVIGDVILYPILGVKFNIPYAFKQETCNYTEEGRKLIHKNINMDTKILRYLMENPIKDASAEYNDNRISLFSAQKGICGISKEKLTIGNMEVHHKIPKYDGGKDDYKNLIFITKNVHKLIHAKNECTIEKYLERVKPTKEMLKKINKLRENLKNRKPISI